MCIIINCFPKKNCQKETNIIHFLCCIGKLGSQCIDSRTATDSRTLVNGRFKTHLRYFIHHLRAHYVPSNVSHALNVSIFFAPVTSICHKNETLQRQNPKEN